MIFKKFGNKLDHTIQRVRSFKNWPLFIWPFTRIGNPNERIAILRNGSRIALRSIFSTDLSVAMEFSPRDPYENDDIKDPSIIADIGANIGVFAISMARKFPKAKIYAIEPEESNYNQLIKNIRLNKLKNITPIRALVSAGSGKRTLFLSDLSTCHSLLHRNSGQKQEVEAITLASFGKIDVLKIDTEGAEYEIFRDYIPDCGHILMEVHPVEGESEENLINKFRNKYSVLNESPIYKMKKL